MENAWLRFGPMLLLMGLGLGISQRRWLWTSHGYRITWFPLHPLVSPQSSHFFGFYSPDPADFGVLRRAWLSLGEE